MFELIIDHGVGNIAACGDIEIMKFEIMIARLNPCRDMARMT